MSRRTSHRPSRRPGIRIIAGRWRGRRLEVPDLPGLRPTGDRARETLFNWLAPFTRGARVLDMFAGTGALGLEALSRGAACVTFVDKSSAACRHLHDACRTLGAEHVDIVHADALQQIDALAGDSFDIVFLDPPFGERLQGKALDLLATNGWVADGGLVYIEDEVGGVVTIPDGWSIRRDKAVGNVVMRLLQKPPTV